jgi:hypothetical protein
MVVMDPDSAPVFEDGIMLYHVTIDGAPVRAGFTLDAVDMLMQRAGDLAHDDSDGTTVGDLLSWPRPTIEAHLQSKHFRQGGSAEPLIIEVQDLVSH